MINSRTNKDCHSVSIYVLSCASLELEKWIDNDNNRSAVSNGTVHDTQATTLDWFMLERNVGSPLSPVRGTV